MSDWLRDKSVLSGGYAQPQAQPQPEREPLDPECAEHYRERMRRALEGTEQPVSIAAREATESPRIED